MAKQVDSNFQVSVKGIQVDLVNLMKNRAKDKEFAQIDDVLDNTGSQIEKDLAGIAASVLEEQREAAAAQELMISRSALVSLIVFILTLAVSIPVFF